MEDNRITQKHIEDGELQNNTKAHRGWRIIEEPNWTEYINIV